jgi:tartrate dehydratase beta subunit/fumarate hydratase class I family protein
MTYLKNHPVYYAGPAKQKECLQEVLDQLLPVMDVYVENSKNMAEA